MAAVQPRRIRGRNGNNIAGMLHMTSESASGKLVFVLVGPVPPRCSVLHGVIVVLLVVLVAFAVTVHDVVMVIACAPGLCRDVRCWLLG